MTAPLRASPWVTAAALFVILTVSSGLGFYNLSVYMTLLAQQRAFDVADVSVAVGLFFLVGGAAGLYVGRLLQDHDPRLIIIVGALLGGAALALIGEVQTIGQLLVVYGVFGIGNTCVSIIPATTLIARWFDAQRRPLALSFTSTGLSLGGVVLTPLSAALLARLPLEVAVPFLGLAYALIIAPVAWWFVGTPAGDVGGARDASHRATGMAFTDAVRSRFFVLLTVGYVLVLGTQVGGIAHVYNRGVEIVTPLQASLAVSVLASLSVLGRLLGGVIVGWISMRAFTLFNVFGQGAGFVLIGYAADVSTFWIGVAVFGFTVGNLLMLQPLLLAQAYGVSDYPRIYSVSQGAATIGIACGPVLLGSIHSMSDYQVGFMSLAMLSIVAFATILAAGAVPLGEAVT